MIKLRVQDKKLSLRPGFHFFISLLSLLIVTIPLSGCLKEWNEEEVQSWYDDKPTDFEGYLVAARKMVMDNRPDKAKEYLRGAIKFIDSQWGPQDVRIATAADELGFLLEREGNLEEALTIYKKGYFARKSVLDKNNEDLKRNQKKVSELYRKLGKDAEANKVDAELDGQVKEPAGKQNRNKKAPKRRKRHID